MLKNKKGLVLKALILTIIAVIAAIAFIRGGGKIYAAVFDPESEYQKSFNKFVEDVNRMKLEKDTIPIKLEKGSAIIGFSSSGDCKCYNCYGNDPSTVTIKFIRPSDLECANNACACLCENLDFDASTPKVAQCEKLSCETLNKEITSFTNVAPNEGGVSWTNGFLFANDVDQANGLPKYSEVKTYLYVDYEAVPNNLITVRNIDMRKYNDLSQELQSFLDMPDPSNPSKKVEDVIIDIYKTDGFFSCNDNFDNIVNGYKGFPVEFGVWLINIYISGTRQRVYPPSQCFPTVTGIVEFQFMKTIIVPSSQTNLDIKLELYG